MQPEVVTRSARFLKSPDEQFDSFGAHRAPGGRHTGERRVGKCRELVVVGADGQVPGNLNAGRLQPVCRRHAAGHHPG